MWGRTIIVVLADDEMPLFHECRPGGGQRRHCQQAEHRLHQRREELHCDYWV